MGHGRTAADAVLPLAEFVAFRVAGLSSCCCTGATGLRNGCLRAGNDAVIELVAFRIADLSSSAAAGIRDGCLRRGDSVLTLTDLVALGVKLSGTTRATGIDHVRAAGGIRSGCLRCAADDALIELVAFRIGGLTQGGAAAWIDDLTEPGAAGRIDRRSASAACRRIDQDRTAGPAG